MPRQKNFKKLVRDRAAKTGESYTAARAHFVAPPPRPATDPDAAALTRALAAAGVLNPRDGKPFTEALVFGLGGGIGFQYMVFAYQGWTSIALDGRCNTLYFERKGFIENACARLGVPLQVQQLPSPETAEKRLRAALAATPEVALTLDLVKLPGHPGDGPYVPYLPSPVTVSEHGGDLAVTGLAGGRTTMSWADLIDARWSQHKKYGGLFRLGTPANPPDVAAVTRDAIARTAECLLEPSKSSFDANFGIPAIRKWARLLTDEKDAKGWPKLCPDDESRRLAMLSVSRGLGEAASRPQFAAFLAQAATLLGDARLAGSADTYDDLGRRWAKLVALTGEPGTTAADLAALLPGLADAEEAAATALR
ncbi:MAG TPA: DUF4872 domain-containing protein [Actinophytocola sp.]|jgi:hypothetical protein|uniref:BtrH N-terminal domain-containing protein n=1 Tax=Actinophytocola sp. TaxID=1872138 RepID=UPI002F92D6D3